MATVRNDEIELPEDPEGETKVNKDGTLLGDREYKVRVFKISGKGSRLYMLSTEPARCIGFRDSYLFFQKHKTLWKIILTEEAKRDLIERSLIPHSYKGRAIGVVTARSVFREFGARIIIGGRKVIDDYQVAASRERGDIEGQLAVPDDQIPGEGDPYDKNRFVAWHGASAVYHSGGPGIPLPNGKAVEGKKRKVIVTGSNWMLEHAREARYVEDSMYLILINRSPAADSIPLLRRCASETLRVSMIPIRTRSSFPGSCSQHTLDGKHFRPIPACPWTEQQIKLGEQRSIPTLFHPFSHATS